MYDGAFLYLASRDEHERPVQLMEPSEGAPTRTSLVFEERRKICADIEEINSLSRFEEMNSSIRYRRGRDLVEHFEPVE